MTAARTLVAGIGNVFFGDDAFGVEVANRLLSRRFSENVKVVDFGIRGMHLAYEIVSGYDVVIFVDAVGGRDGAPGTLYLIEPAPGQPSGKVADAHGMDLDNVFAFVNQLGGSKAKWLLVGCKPADTEEGMGLSDAVAAAIPAAAALVEDLIATYGARLSGSAPAAQTEAIV